MFPIFRSLNSNIDPIVHWFLFVSVDLDDDDDDDDDDLDDDDDDEDEMIFISSGKLARFVHKAFYLLVFNGSTLTDEII